MLKCLKWVCLVLLVAGNAHAQMSHQVLLLVNKNSQPSKLVANTFAALRGIPSKNIVYLDIPQKAYTGSATITPEEFTRLIWEPANEIEKARKIDDRILAWVYSVDFPIRVKTDSNDRKQVSVSGLTFLRNHLPALDMVEKGSYFSKLFAGPNNRLKLFLPSTSLDVRKKGLGEEILNGAEYLKSGLGGRMPLPSMMLGYIGEKGTDVETVLKVLDQGVKSDCVRRRRNIYFIQSDDVRSQCRSWQYDPVSKELKKFGIQCIISTNFPAGAKQVMGIMMGAEKVNPYEVGSFAPGAMAEHLTSWGAEFQKPQTKITRWLEAGATATAGTVVEPYAIADKFPSARYFVHSVSGCTILESFYQSIACPLQNLLLGDPLAKPYAIPVTARILGSEKINRDFTYLMETTTPIPNPVVMYTFFLDGELVQDWSLSASLFFRVQHLSDGYHEIRGVTYLKGLIHYSAFAVKGFSVNRLGRSISISPEISSLGLHEHGISVKISGIELPEKIRLFCGEELLDEKPYSDDIVLLLDELQIGEGPNRIRAVAIYDDGMEVSSVPLNFSIHFNAPEKE